MVNALACAVSEAHRPFRGETDGESARAVAYRKCVSAGDAGLGGSGTATCRPPRCNAVPSRTGRTATSLPRTGRRAAHVRAFRAAAASERSRRGPSATGRGCELGHLLANRSHLLAIAFVSGDTTHFRCSTFAGNATSTTLIPRAPNRPRKTSTPASFVRADPRIRAKRLRETIGDEAPIHARALPQLEDERAQPAAIDDAGRQLLVRDVIEVRQGCPVYPQRSAARGASAKCTADWIEKLTSGAVSRG